MKNVSIIIKFSIKDELSDILKKESYINSFTLTSTECHNRQCEVDPQFSDRDLVVGHIPKIKVEVQIEDEYLDQLLEILKGVGGLKGNCSLYVTSLDTFMQL